MRVVVAPDKFKGSATAAEAARAIAAGLRAGRPDLEVVELPVADGGDGTVAAAIAAGFTPVVVTADGPTGEPVQATFALSTLAAPNAGTTADVALPPGGRLSFGGGLAARGGHASGGGFSAGGDKRGQPRPGRDGAMSGAAVANRVAVIELAEVAGLRVLPPAGASRPGLPASGHGPDRIADPALWPGRTAPLTASTYGLGQLISAALDRGARTIVLGVGGSASTDGGAGMLQALGVRLADGQGRPLGRGGAALGDLAVVDPAGLDQRLGTVRFLVASDVDNPLLGPAGAAAVFGPQKGASPAEVVRLERGLARWAELTMAVSGRDVTAAAGAGAAGGTGFAALAYLGARLRPGIDVVLELIGFDATAAGAGLVITGEGRLDAQTLSGKAPVGVARASARLGVPVAVVAGQVLLTGAELALAGFSAAYSLAVIEPDPARSIARVGELLERIGRQIAASAPVAPPPG